MAFISDVDSCRLGMNDFPALSSLLNSKADLSGDMALRIEKAFGVKMDTLMRMQSSYDIAQTRKREKEIRVRRIRQPAEIHL
jgi:antitoxin HigA-1